jgi:hypothetical protein
LSAATTRPNFFFFFFFFFFFPLLFSFLISLIKKITFSSQNHQHLALTHPGNFLAFVDWLVRRYSERLPRAVADLLRGAEIDRSSLGGENGESMDETDLLDHSSSPPRPAKRARHRSEGSDRDPVAAAETGYYDRGDDDHGGMIPAGDGMDTRSHLAMSSTGFHGGDDCSFDDTAAAGAETAAAAATSATSATSAEPATMAAADRSGHKRSGKNAAHDSHKKDRSRKSKSGKRGGGARKSDGTGAVDAALRRPLAVQHLHHFNEGLGNTRRLFRQVVMPKAPKEKSASASAAAAAGGKDAATAGSSQPGMAQAPIVHAIGAAVRRSASIVGGLAESGAMAGSGPAKARGSGSMAAPPALRLHAPLITQASTARAIAAAQDKARAKVRAKAEAEARAYRAAQAEAEAAAAMGVDASPSLGGSQARGRVLVPGTSPAAPRGHRTQVLIPPTPDHGATTTRACVWGQVFSHYFFLNIFFPLEPLSIRDKHIPSPNSPFFFFFSFSNSTFLHVILFFPRCALVQRSRSRHAAG